MHGTFVESHRVAGFLLVATVLGSIALEWTVTARERIRSTLGPEAGSVARSRVAVSTLVETATARTTGDSRRPIAKRSAFSSGR